MPFFGSFAQGLSESISEERQLRAKQNEADAAREHAALTHLATSPDPEIAAHAITGLMGAGTGKRASGLSGFFGANEKNPALATIRGLIQKGSPMPGNTPEGGQATMGTGAGPGGADPAAEAAAGVPPAEGSAALPARSLVSPVAGPPSAAGPAPAATIPRHVFRTPDEQMRLSEEAQVSGKLNALKPYLSPEQMHTAALGVGGVHVPMTGQFMGNNQKPDGSWVRQERYFDTNQGTWQIAEVPIATPQGLQVKPTYQTLADPQDANRPHVYRILPNGTRTDLGAKAVVNGLIQGVDPETQEAYTLQVPRTFAGGSGRPAAGAATPPPGAAVAASPPAGPAVAPVAAPPPAAGAGAATPPPGASGGPARPGTTQPAAKRGNIPAGAISRGRQRSLTQTEGAVMGPNGMPQETAALEDKGTGKYYDPRNPSQELTGFIPGDMGKSAVQAFANGQNTIDTIDKALEALRKSGLADSKDPADTLKLQMMYRGGANPVVSALGSLTSLASLQGSSQYVKGNSRSFQMFQRAAQHTALLPSDAEASWGTTPMVGGMVTPKNAMRTGHPPWDSPAALIEKLQTSRQITQQGLDELRQSTGKVPERATGGRGGAAAAPPGASQPVYAWDPQGVRHLQTDPNAQLPAGWTSTPPRK